jgi:hypothetical protein
MQHNNSNVSVILECNAALLSKYRLHQKHLTAFEIWKPMCLLSATSILTVINYSDVWSLADMQRWSMQHHIAAVESFIKTESVTVKQHGFWQQFHRCDAPSHNTLLLWVSKWCQVGSVKERKPIERPLSARTPDVKPVRDTMLQSPHRSAFQQPLCTWLKGMTCSINSTKGFALPSIKNPSCPGT